MILTLFFHCLFCCREDASKKGKESSLFWIWGCSTREWTECQVAGAVSSTLAGRRSTYSCSSSIGLVCYGGQGILANGWVSFTPSLHTGHSWYTHGYAIKDWLHNDDNPFSHYDIFNMVSSLKPLTTSTPRSSSVKFSRSFELCTGVDYAIWWPR